MRWIATALLSILAMVSEVGLVKYDRVLNILTQRYEHQREEYKKMYRQDVFKWSFVEYNRFPFECSEYDFGKDSNEVGWVWNEGPIIGMVRGDSTNIQVAVLSYIDRRITKGQKKQQTVEALVYRMYFFKRNSSGTWYENKTPQKVVENWNGEMYVCQ